MTPRERLEQAAAGLVYTSEGDAPFEWVELAEAPGGAREVTLERFFAGHIEESDPNDPASQALVERYRSLRETLRETFPDIRVFRVGEVEIRCYLVGRAPGGGLAGLATTAWES
ncbi:MAG TPA: nuclease A inhibitor family protein [Archangium sp.]